MFKLKKIKLKKIKQFFQTLPYLLREYYFLTFLAFILLAFIFSGLVFYKYTVLVQRKQAEIPEGALAFNEKNLHEILKIWQEREKKFKETDLKTYPNPFR